MPATGAVGDGTRLAWRVLPTLLPLSLGAVFWAQVGTLHGPEAVYPAALAMVLVAVSGYNLVRELIAHRSRVRTAVGVEASTPRTERPVSEAPAAEEDEPEVDRLTVGRPVAVIALLLLTLTLITPLGFFAALPVLLVGVLAVTGVRRPLPLAIAVAGVWLGAYVVFDLILGVPLPTGIWW
ncbi:MAG TPA: tripartite tricarboxylate transporter TctB family protein [Nocardiopsis listeri]|uniref:tripartite tricarboxylate transporter TctB family protein n=1 Tax=Nocardiopsis listeri TaxID=53440 RepID=UPI001D2BEE2D|nr:tripartite tricarboxylate transporter TctB family protein [Nocardiopsis listeri]HJE57275.1 tripartite tricarboxylate transporter TctB family protein [Nocardiopsis listeri]